MTRRIYQLEDEKNLLISRFSSRKVDIEKHPLQSIGLVAGAIVAIVCWAAVGLRGGRYAFSLPQACSRHGGESSCRPAFFFGAY